MDRGSRVFWLLFGLLMGCSIYFGVRAETFRRSLGTARNATLESGQTVRLERVIDGDTVLVDAGPEGRTTVRLLGIKAFSKEQKKDPSVRFGQAAIDRLKTLIDQGALTVEVPGGSRDRHGRTLARLFDGDRDVGLDLVEQGLALVYTLYPFDSMPAYLRTQEQARAEKRGLWADPDVARRAEALLSYWEEEGD